MEDVWIEKYRPNKLSQVIGQDEIVSRLKAYVKATSMPHLLFAGPAGTGKTTCAIALAKELFGDAWKENFNETNASDERGIQVVRTKIKDFARTAPLGKMPFKIMFLDEADALTTDAQAALRRTMERFTKTCRFILSVNYSSKIIEPIQSRCAVFRFRPIKADDEKKYLRYIAEEENLKLTEEGLEAIVYIAGGDMRKAISALQVAASVSKKIDENSIYKITSTAKPDEVKALLELAVKGDFLRARGLLDELLIEYGLSGEDIIKQIHRAIFDLNISDEAKVQLIDRAGEIEFRIVEGGNERIQLESLLAYFAFVGSRKR
jgi:replication factor C small subunit